MENIEEKLDEIICLLERQNELSEKMSSRLSDIYGGLPKTTNINTSGIESILRDIWQKLDDR